MKLIDSMVAGSILVAAATLGYVAFSDSQPPIEFLSARAESPIYRSGGTLRVLYRVDKTRSCPARITRFIIKEPDGPVVYSEEQPGGYSRVGQSSVVVEIKMPPLEPGPYRHHSIISYQCTFFQNTVVMTPDVQFQIISE